MLNSRFRARATELNGLHRGSAGRWPAYPDPGILLIVWSAQHHWLWRSTLVHPPKSATNFPCLACKPFFARQIGVWFRRRHFLRKCGWLTAPFRAVGRALPSPTLFRRIHAHSVRSGGRGVTHQGKGGYEASPRRSHPSHPEDFFWNCFHFATNQKARRTFSQSEKTIFRQMGGAFQYQCRLTGK